jgi:hypothetical protein
MKDKAGIVIYELPDDIEPVYYLFEGHTSLLDGRVTITWNPPKGADLKDFLITPDSNETQDS